MNYSWQNLKRRIADTKSPVGAEIGVHRGDFSRRVLENVPGCTLYMVDMWSPSTYDGIPTDAATPERIREYQDNWLDNYMAALKVALVHAPRGIPIRGRSLEVAASLAGRVKLDFVYLDAAHDEMSLLCDISAWVKLVKPGGWIGGHDYGDNFPGVVAAVDKVFPGAEIDSDFTWWWRVV